MKGRRALAAALLAVGTMAGAAGCRATESGPRQLMEMPAVQRPNVVVILADDLGWSDVSTYGRTAVATPNIDRIASSGAAFSSGYVAASVCALSRAALLTGRMPQEYGFTYNINDEGNDGAGLPVDQPTLAERLRPLGYSSAAIGKWHLGSDRQFYPTNRGFDEFFGFLAGETVFVDPKTPGIVTTPTRADKYPLSARKGNGVIVEGPEARRVDNFDRYLTTEITDRAIDFIRRSAGEKRPFFAYVAYNAPHWPLQVPQEWYDRLDHVQDPVRRTYLAMIAAMDNGIGQILDTLEAEGLRRNTIVVFLSDNGCPVQFGFCAPDHPWSAGKFTYLEGGVRVPFVISWPAGMAPSGIIDAPVNALDVVPTVLRAIDPGAPLPQGIGGVSLVTTAAGQAPAQRVMVWGQEPLYSARMGNYKLLQSRATGQSNLYDLTRDPGELADLSQAQAATRDALARAIEDWRARLPEPRWPMRQTRTITVNGRDAEMVY